MAYQALWKYATPAHCNAFLLSLGLLDGLTVPEGRQLACLYALSNHAKRHYRAAEIPKRDGTMRRLQVPDALLMRVQRNLLDRVLAGFAPSEAATAYRPGASVMANAAPHAGQAQVLRLDIASFFDSITFPLVYRYAFPAASFPPAVRSVLAHLCCCGDRLPQGAPTSAAVSNLVMKPFDLRLLAWCAERGIRYTRYCDDMVFSGNFDPWAVRRQVRSLLAPMGLALREDKTRLMRPHQRQAVTGVVVNAAPQVARATRDALRQAVYYCRKYGVRDHMAHIGETRDARTYLRSLLGKIGFVLQVNPGDTAFQAMRAEVKQMLQKEGTS